MHESLSITTKGGNDAPARVRRALMAFSDDFGEKTDDVRLIVTELVTNAVVHSGLDCESLFQFALWTSPDRISCALLYQGDPFAAEPQPGNQRFGLHLVDTLSDDWGVERGDNKNRVWFEINQ
jgi:anti-sigma regulatory factor (Ser/Thr protein kinase)